MDRLYIGLDRRNTVIVDHDDRILTLSRNQWDGFVAAGGELSHMGLLPEDRDIDTITAFKRE